MTSVLYFLHLKTLDIILVKNVNFQQLFVVVKMTERRKNQRMDLLHSVIYLLYNSK